MRRADRSEKPVRLLAAARHRWDSRNCWVTRMPPKNAAENSADRSWRIPAPIPFAAFGYSVFGAFVPGVAVIRGSFRGIRGIRGPQQIQARDPRRDFEPRSNPFRGSPS